MSKSKAVVSWIITGPEAPVQAIGFVAHDADDFGHVFLAGLDQWDLPKLRAFVNDVSNKLTEVGY